MATKPLYYRTVGRRGDRWPIWVRSLMNRSGVYVIKDIDSGAVLYVGESHTGRLYATLTRHFQQWSGRTAGEQYKRRNVKIAVKTCPPQSAVAAQDNLISRLRPLDNDTNPRGGDDVAPF